MPYQKSNLPFLYDDVTGDIVGVKDADGSESLFSRVEGWAMTQAWRLVSATRNGDGVVTSATIAWPDGVQGTYTALTFDASGAVASWTATYAGRTITQPAITFDANGAVTAQPALTIT